MMKRKDENEERAGLPVIAEIAKLDREMAEYLIEELEKPKNGAYQGLIVPARIPTTIGEQYSPVVTSRVVKFG
ncbi:MAG: hypothetical protein L0229_15870 [Blastocatellia bacterium]|nr:hypothetical protein [Blastocatellia bacterium]